MSLDANVWWFFAWRCWAEQGVLICVLPRKTLKERIPEIEKVVDIQPEQEPLTAAGVEEVRPAELPTSPM